MLVYPTYIVANLIVDGWPVGTPGGRGHLVRLALVGALAMAAWDLVVDPILSGPTVGAWVWERGGPYYGVPLQNSLGWIVTTFTVYLLYRSVERRWTLQRVEPLSLGPSGIASSPNVPMKVGSPVPAQQARSVRSVGAQMQQFRVDQASHGSAPEIRSAPRHPRNGYSTSGWCPPCQSSR
jgi:Carotenoid biosynthesis protein